MKGVVKGEEDRESERDGAVPIYQCFNVNLYLQRYFKCGSIYSERGLSESDGSRDISDVPLILSVRQGHQLTISSAQFVSINANIYYCSPWIRRIYEVWNKYFPISKSIKKNNYSYVNILFNRWFLVEKKDKIRKKRTRGFDYLYHRTKTFERSFLACSDATKSRVYSQINYA